METSIVGESRLSDFLVGLFEDRGIACERIPVASNRANVIARVDGSQNYPTILLDAHQDTVPVDNMTIPPFDPIERDGRVYGRGSCDVKGGMAAMICALDRCARRHVASQGDGPTVIMTCTCDEEYDQLGAVDVAQSFSKLEHRKSQLLQKPDLVVVAEPTELNVGVAHRGVVRWEILTHGVAAHSSDPQKGTNAIYRMARLVTELENYAGVLRASDASANSTCGPRTLSVGVISGGESVNTVPSVCAIEIDRRIVPGEDPQNVMRDVEEYLQARIDFDFEMAQPTTVAEPLTANANQALADSLLESCRTEVADRNIVSLPFTTQAPRFANAGIATVVFGPGSIHQAHTADEWISITQLEQATDILDHFLSNV